MCFEQLIAHRDDVVDGKLRCRMRVQHCRVVNKLFSAGHGRFNGEELDIDVRHIHRGALHRQITDDRRRDTGAVYKAGNLDTGIFHEIGD